MNMNVSNPSRALVPNGVVDTDPPAYFQMTRNQPFFSSSTDTKQLALTRAAFTNTQDLPCFEALPVPGKTGADINNTIYEVKLETTTSQLRPVTAGTNPNWNGSNKIIYFSFESDGISTALSGTYTCNIQGGALNGTPIVPLDIVTRINLWLATFFAATTPPPAVAAPMPQVALTSDGRITVNVGPPAGTRLFLDMTLLNAAGTNKNQVLQILGARTAKTELVTGYTFPYTCGAYTDGANWLDVTLATTQTIGVVWQPEDVTVPVPATSPDVGKSDPYYWGYSMGHFTELVNTAISTAVAAAIAEISASVEFASELPITYTFVTPSLKYKPDTDKFTLTITAPSARTWTVRNPYTTVTLSFNRHLYLLFCGFRAYDSGDAWWHTLAVPAAAADVLPSVDVDQEFASTVGTWSPVDSIVMTTRTMPTRSEDTQNVATTLSSSVLSTTANFSSAVCDIQGQATSALNWRQGCYFSPYMLREIVVAASATCNTLDMELRWRHRLTGELIPLLIPPNTGVSAKLRYNN